MSAKEVQGWARYFADEPDNSVEIQLALLANMVSSAFGGKGKLEDFLITRALSNTKKADIEDQISPDEVKNKFLTIAGTVK